MKILDGKRLAYYNNQPQWFNHPVPLQGQEAQDLTVAVSAETGSGAVQIADRLAEYLQGRAPNGTRPWRVFNKNLMAKVLEDHHLPVRLAKFMPEDTHNPVDDLLDELLGLHPPASVVVNQSIETIQKLAREGNVILVGWGVNAITASLPNVFHVRLVGSLEKRLARIEARERLDRKEALAFIQRSDRGRARYVKRYLHRQVSDVLLYDLVLNTDRFSETELAQVIGDTALGRKHTLAPIRTVPLAECII